MAKSNLPEIRQKDEKQLLAEKSAMQAKIVEERSSLASSGKKNSNSVKKLKKEIARIETVLTEKFYESIKG